MSRMMDPAHGAVAVSTNTTIPQTRGVYVGSGGDLVVTMASGASCTFVGVPTGTLLPIRITLMSSSSTAGSVVALY